VEQGREPAGPRSQVQDPFSGLNGSDFDEPAEPERAVGGLVGSDGIVVLRPPRVVDRHGNLQMADGISGCRDIPMTVAEFSITPIGKGASVGAYIARCLDIVDRSGLPYRLNAMGTVVEGEFDDILKLVARCHKAVAEDCERVSTTLKIDDRKGVSGQLESKVKDVERRLGRKLRT
jgi:uncharacterized protein (TIGR00106 family)